MTSFKGTEIGIERAEIDGEESQVRIRFSVQFTDQDGLVHAVTTHDVTVDGSSTGTKKDIAEAAESLAAALRDWCYEVHFDQKPASTDNVSIPDTGAPHGIAESLRTLPDEPGDPA